MQNFPLYKEIIILNQQDFDLNQMIQENLDLIINKQQLIEINFEENQLNQIIQFYQNQQNLFKYEFAYNIVQYYIINTKEMQFKNCTYNEGFDRQHFILFIILFLYKNKFNINNYAIYNLYIQIPYLQQIKQRFMKYLMNTKSFIHDVQQLFVMIKQEEFIKKKQVIIFTQQLNNAIDIMKNGIFLTQEIYDIQKIEWIYRAKLAKAGYLFVEQNNSFVLNNQFQIQNNDMKVWENLNQEAQNLLKNFKQNHIHILFESYFQKFEKLLKIYKCSQQIIHQYQNLQAIPQISSKAYELKIQLILQSPIIYNQEIKQQLVKINFSLLQNINLDQILHILIQSYQFYSMNQPKQLEINQTLKTLQQYNQDKIVYKYYQNTKQMNDHIMIDNVVNLLIKIICVYQQFPNDLQKQYQKNMPFIDINQENGIIQFNSHQKQTHLLEQNELITEFIQNNKILEKHLQKLFQNPQIQTKQTIQKQKNDKFICLSDDELL